MPTKTSTMKKLFVGALVGGIILFIWQFLSWSLINLHKPSQQFTPKQNVVMNTLNENLEEGGYFMPGLQEEASMDEYKKLMEDSKGKPWATIQYHKSNDTNMAKNMILGVVINVITVWLLCWILAKMNAPTFATVLTASLFSGLIVFFNVPYTNHIWYQSFDIWAHFIDAIVSWGLCGLWLAWWFSRKQAATRIKLTKRSQDERA